MPLNWDDLPPELQVRIAEVDFTFRDILEQDDRDEEQKIKDLLDKGAAVLAKYDQVHAATLEILREYERKRKNKKRLELLIALGWFLFLLAIML